MAKEKVRIAHKLQEGDPNLNYYEAIKKAKEIINKNKEEQELAWKLHNERVKRLAEHKEKIAVKTPAEEEKITDKEEGEQLSKRKKELRKELKKKHPRWEQWKVTLEARKIAQSENLKLEPKIMHTFTQLEIAQMNAKEKTEKPKIIDERDYLHCEICGSKHKETFHKGTQEFKDWLHPVDKI